jgi:hypothetical protein
MIELLQYATSGFWIFWGCLILSTTFICSIGWAVNAIIIGFRGKSV